MKLNELKQSMMYTACPYKREPVDMAKFLDIDNKTQVKPERDALEFYLAVQIMGIIELKYGVDVELPKEVAELAVVHHNTMEQVFFRMFTYIMLISIGESRHGSLGGSMQSTITKKFGSGVYEFARDIKGVNRSNSRSTYMNSNRDMLTFSEYCEWAFIECFSGGSYGGKPWKNIANKVTSVLKGDISPYTMVDISWALVHNTGSIFNKNTIYHKDHGSTLAVILDIQRGGGIASHILNKNYSGMIGDGDSSPMVHSTQVADTILEGALSVVVSPLTIKHAGALNYKFINLEEEGVETTSEENTKWLVDSPVQLGIMSFPTVKRSN